MIDDLWYVLLIIIVLVLYMAHSNLFCSKRRENFNNIGDITVKRGDDIYDDFYVSAYDDLLYDDFRTSWEIGYAINYMNGDNNYILDVGSGTGNTIDTLNRIGIDALGIDKSEAMTNYSKKTFKNSEFRTADITQSMIFEPETFSVITCFYFTIYYIEDKRVFFENCMNYLKPGGILVLHLVDREKFDTLLPSSNPIYILSPQDYANKRITRSVGKFKNHDYTSDFIFNGKDVIFYETFTNKETGRIRKHELKLYMDYQREILKLARNVGFILEAHSEMDKCEYKKQYLYVLRKPR